MAPPTVTPIAATDEQLAEVRYDTNGLVPAIVQEEGTGRVLMMAWMTEATLRQSLEEGRTVFWSRSRQEVWRKGDTSGDRQWVREARYDCDADVLLFIVEQEKKLPRWERLGCAVMIALGLVAVVVVYTPSLNQGSVSFFSRALDGVIRWWFGH